jgi:S1-C subfamily serine protease
LRAIILSLALIAGVGQLAACGSASEKSAAPVTTMDVVDTHVFTIRCVDDLAHPHWASMAMGTAFFVSDVGDFVTAAHIFRNGIPPIISKFGKCVAIVDLWGTPVGIKNCTAGTYDIVDCSLVRNPFTTPPLLQQDKVLRLEIVEQPTGAPITVSGFPTSLIGHVTSSGYVPITRSGYVLHYGRLSPSDSSQTILVHVKTTNGFSGAPILDANGDVVGILLMGRGKGRITPATVTEEAVGHPATLIEYVMSTRKYPWKRLLSSKS